VPALCCEGVMKVLQVCVSSAKNSQKSCVSKSKTKSLEVLQLRRGRGIFFWVGVLLGGKV
jgi:hypothetical protein